jgi:hypothetical protein
MIGKVLVGTAAVFGAVVALGRTDRGRELLLAADARLQDLDARLKAKVEEQGGNDAAEKLEETVRRAAERAAASLGLNLDDLKVYVQGHPDENPQPDKADPPRKDEHEADTETGGLGG